MIAAAAASSNNGGAFLVLLLFLFAIGSAASKPRGRVWVRAHRRRDGSFVRGHWRSR